MDQKIQEIVTRVLEGNASDEERGILRDWIQIKEENRRELEQAEGLWNALEILNNREKFQPQKGYKDFERELQKRKTNPTVSPKKLRVFHLMRIAASVLIITGISYLVWHYFQSSIDKIAYFELTTPNGSHTQLTLTDGTTIWLNAGSKLKYPQKFIGKTRQVFLEGEAYFNVKKDPEHPFIVQTSYVNIKALGTSFNVKAYSNEGSIETTLVNGIVVIEGNSATLNKIETIRLLPNQKATFIKTTGRLFLNDHEQKQLINSNTDIKLVKREKESVIVSEEVNTELYTSWIDNRLLFDNETFESISYKLQRRYGAVIIFKDPKIKRYRFSGKFPEISIDRALNALQFASPFDYDIKHDTIYIK